ncbi:hypothetical protein [Streptomyces sp. NPDC020917]|uniref:hypothetical protein n=1 Tax=Streptomyces sp. NPDC020917 TaxID=3365102 RepID=UPI0037A026AB
MVDGSQPLPEWSARDLRRRSLSAATREWLRLEWDAEQDVRTVHLVLDDDVDEYPNNLHRHRTPFEVMHELVSDYRLQARDEQGVWHTVASVRANRRRHRVHRFETPVRTRALRIAVDAVHGAGHARVVAVRAYGD